MLHQLQVITVKLTCAHTCTGEVLFALRSRTVIIIIIIITISDSNHRVALLNLRTIADKAEEEIWISTHASAAGSLGGLIQSVNKMDFISALQFLKLKEVSHGEILHVMQKYYDIFLC